MVTQKNNKNTPQNPNHLTQLDQERSAHASTRAVLDKFFAENKKLREQLLKVENEQAQRDYDSVQKNVNKTEDVEMCYVEGNENENGTLVCDSIEEVEVQQQQQQPPSSSSIGVNTDQPIPQEPDPDQCSICLENAQPGEGQKALFITACCKKPFHFDCISKWKKTNLPKLQTEDERGERLAFFGSRSSTIW